MQARFDHLPKRFGDKTAFDIPALVACEDGALPCRPGEWVAVQIASIHLYVFDECGNRLEVV